MVIAFLVGRTGTRRAIADVNGTWQLWVVGTASVAIAATSAYAAGVVPDRPAAWAASAAWAAAALLYVLVTALVITRLRTVGLAVFAAMIAWLTARWRSARQTAPGP